MPVSDYLMALGQFSVRVQPEKLRRILRPYEMAGIDAGRSYSNRNPGTGFTWDTLCITPAVIDDPEVTKATVLANARYTGRILDTNFDTGELSGHHILGWMGDDQGQGQFDGLVLPPKTFAQMIVAGFADIHDMGQGITIGTAYGSPATVINGDGLVTKETFRVAIERWCRIVNAEYRCNPDTTFDYGTAAGGLFRTTPEVVILEDDGGPDPGGLFGVRSTIGVRRNGRSMIHNTWVIGNGNTAGAFGGVDLGKANLSGTTTASIWRRLTSSSSDGGDLANQATTELTANYVEAFEFTVTTDLFDPGRRITPGDTVCLYSPRNYIIGTDSQAMTYHGGIIKPVQYRCVGIEDWKVRKPMGVYLIRTSDASGTVYPQNTVFPVHDSMIWDDDTPARLVISQLPRQLSWAIVGRDH